MTNNVGEKQNDGGLEAMAKRAIVNQGRIRNCIDGNLVWNYRYIKPKCKASRVEAGATTTATEH